MTYWRWWVINSVHERKVMEKLVTGTERAFDRILKSVTKVGWRTRSLGRSMQRTEARLVEGSSTCMLISQRSEAGVKRYISR